MCGKAFINDYSTLIFISFLFTAISFEKFLVIMAKAPEEEKEEDLNEAFRVFDKDGNGKLLIEASFTFSTKLG